MSDWNKKSDQWLLKAIGESFKGRRLLKNISQEELSLKSGISKASITRFETSRGNISLSALLSLLKALGIANELKTIFQDPSLSPALGTQERVRKSKRSEISSDQSWQWGEDKE